MNPTPDPITREKLLVTRVADDPSGRTGMLSDPITPEPEQEVSIDFPFPYSTGSPQRVAWFPARTSP